MNVQNLALLFCYVFLCTNVSAAGLLFLNCTSTAKFTSNSAYGKNLDVILSSLPDNASRNDGFFMTTVGQGLDQVYALALCRGDASSEKCSRCVSLRVRDIRASCPNQKKAFLWEGDVVCLVRYADLSFFGNLELQPSKAALTSVGLNVVSSIVVSSNVGSSNIPVYSQPYPIWSNLKTGLVEIASNGSSRLKFATGIANVDSGKIYALMQCTPDLSHNDCKQCLLQTADQFPECCQEGQGGYALTPSCHFRWDLNSFFNSSADTLLLPSPSSPPSPSPPPSSPPSPSPPPPPPPTPHSTTNRNTSREDNGGLESKVVVIIVVPIITSIAILGLACMFLRKRNKTKQENISAENYDSIESLLFDFKAIKASTDNFSMNNKLGQGGFGSVYKGRLQDGRNIAVKRLSDNSAQGDLEFKNEVQLLAKLQHRNLVRLLGFSLEGKERLLIFEFLPNSSLDKFLFNPVRRLQLDWVKRHNIITGTARGILYLHEESQYRIVHRDLKASNILLDKAMNPKIADFGLARLFSTNQTHDATDKRAGTFGYMAPEYIKYGTYSAKSDVYSFGVLVLEIIVGERISCFHSREGEDLLNHAWRSWKTETIIDMIDPNLRDGSRMEIIRCIHIGLLCIQANVASRPTMASVVLMLNSCMSLPLPSQPGFVDSTSEPNQITGNEASMSELDPR